MFPWTKGFAQLFTEAGGKLENLTDIERQLSTRKPAGNFSPDTPHESEKPAPSTDEVTPDEP